MLEDVLYYDIEGFLFSCLVILLITETGVLRNMIIIIVQLPISPLFVEVFASLQRFVLLLGMCICYWIDPFIIIKFPSLSPVTASAYQ